MSKQNCTIEQKSVASTKSCDEFENVENIILSVFKLLKEYDQLMKISEIEMEKIGGEKIE